MYCSGRRYECKKRTKRDCKPTVCYRLLFMHFLYTTIPSWDSIAVVAVFLPTPFNGLPAHITFKKNLLLAQEARAHEAIYSIAS